MLYYLTLLFSLLHEMLESARVLENTISFILRCQAKASQNVIWKKSLVLFKFEKENVQSAVGSDCAQLWNSRPSCVKWVSYVTTCVDAAYSLRELTRRLVKLASTSKFESLIILQPGSFDLPVSNLKLMRSLNAQKCSSSSNINSMCQEVWGDWEGSFGPSKDYIRP